MQTIPHFLFCLNAMIMNIRITLFNDCILQHIANTNIHISAIYIHKFIYKKVNIRDTFIRKTDKWTPILTEHLKFKCLAWQSNAIITAHFVVHILISLCFCIPCISNLGGNRKLSFLHVTSQSYILWFNKIVHIMKQ